ncbi:MAG TPA: P1 family peptidase [Ktedonobacterales bacterium]|jgi:L-aminopeptidase/D-esterase-like protein
MHDDITDVPGILVGHDTDLAAGTGCTVVVCAWPAVGGVDVRGGAPATRETDLLDPRNTVAEVHAVLLAGGSAYGLDAAAGVMRVLEARGVGYDAQAARVPIVPGAALFDLGLGSASVRPDAAAGQRATEAASAGPIARGSVGAGTGATVGKLGGPALLMKGGLGSASATLADGAVVGAIVAVNALGDICDPATGAILAGARHPSGAGWLAEVGAPLAYPFGTDAPAPAPGANTTIAVVATSLPLAKTEAGKVAQMAHDGLARAIRPAHTPFDGDTIFALGLAPAPARAQAPAGVGPLLLAQVGALAAHVLARAVADAVRSATALHGAPAVRDLGDLGHGA